MNQQVDVHSQSVGPQDSRPRASLVSWAVQRPSFTKDPVNQPLSILNRGGTTLTLNQKLIAALNLRLHDATKWGVSHIFDILWVLIVTALAQRIGGYLIDKIFGVIHLGLGGDTTATRANQRARTLAAIVRSTYQACVYFTMGMFMLSVFGINMTPVLASAGILGLAVGLGAQNLIKDVINGFFILLEDQYGVGDVVTIGTYSGLVERMNMRITQLRNSDGNLISIPNGGITVVANQSKDWARAVLSVSVSIQEDIDRVMTILREEGRKLYKDLPGKVLEEPAGPGVDALSETALIFNISVKTAPGAQWEVARNWRYRIKNAFEREHIAMPLPQRMLLVEDGKPDDTNKIETSRRKPTARTDLAN